MKSVLLRQAVILIIIYTLYILFREGKRLEIHYR